GGLPRQKAVSKVQVDCLAEEDEVLFPERAIQPEVAPYGFTLQICGLGAGHHQHWVADQVQTGEHQGRHHEYDQPRLQQATQNGCYHVVLRELPASCLAPRSSDQPDRHSARLSSWPRPTFRTAAAESHSLP